MQVFLFQHKTVISSGASEASSGTRTFKTRNKTTYYCKSPT